MQPEAAKYLERWRNAGLIDDDTAGRIRDFESSQAPTAKTRWAAAIAWGFGALLIGTGIISFVAANWEGMPQTLKMGLILLLTGGFHAAAGFFPKVRALHLALHGIGTACLGAGIALAAQIYNLSSDWNGWMLLWAFGACIGYWLIRDWLQLILAALLIPAWLTAEWSVRGPHGHDALPVVMLWTGLALHYFFSSHKPLVWLGGIGMIPITFMLIIYNLSEGIRRPTTPQAAWWAFGVLVVLFLVAGRKHAPAVGVAAILSYWSTQAGGWSLYPILGAAFAGLCFWGVSGQRAERVNVGIAGFAITVLAFYVSHALSMLGSSLGLVLLGILMLGGGFALEKARRRLTERIA